MPAANGSQSRGEIDALKAQVDLVATIQATGVELRKTGKSYVGHCPFHPSDETPSLSVNPEARLWNCFGCEAGGDVFRFLQLREELSFPQALERVRSLAGLPTNGEARKAPLPGQEGLPGQLARPDLLERVAQHYAQALRQSPAAKAYLASRGLGDPELWEAFGVGFADGTLAVPEHGEVRAALEQVGLVTGEGREFFAGCLVVPLTHPELGVVNLYGRRISSRAKVRHLYLPGPKRGVLNWQGLKANPTGVLVTESVLDALAAWTAGVRDVTCVFGVSGVPQDLEEAFSRFAVREVRLCLDSDEPGQKAARILAERWTEHGLRCFCVPLPAQVKDPNQLLVDQGPTALRQALTLKEPFPGLQGAGGEPYTLDAEHLRTVWRELAVQVTPHPPFKSRLRVTLRLSQRGQGVYRDSFELSSYQARSQRARTLSRLLKVEPSEVERFLLELLEHAELWVDQLRQRSQEPQGDRAPEMSPAERAEALAYLCRSDLVGAILQDMEQLGTVGEDRAKLLAYLVGTSRKLPWPLAAILGSGSGAGKSGIAERLELLMPPEDVVVFSRMSAHALYNMACDRLQRKLVMLDERAGLEACEYPVRNLLSRQKLTQAVTIRDPLTGQLRTQENEVLGPIAYLETTTNLKAVNHENATRCFEIQLDESVEQTRRIHAWQRARRRDEVRALEKVQEAICRRHHNAQRLLEPLSVRIPYVEQLSFPARWLRARRDHERFLCLIEAVAFLHQFQRTGGTLEDGSRFIRATVEDYRIAFDLAQEVLAATFHELSRDAREVLEAIEEMLAEGGPRVDLEAFLFTRRELRHHTDNRWPDYRLRQALEELKEMEYVEQTSGSQGRTCHYRLLPGATAGRLCPLRELTTPDQLQAAWTEPPA